MARAAPAEKASNVWPRIRIGNYGAGHSMSPKGLFLSSLRFRQIPARSEPRGSWSPQRAECLAAVGVGLELGLSASQIRQGLERFHGADRRFQVKAEVDGITVVDDYGHHPAEIRATLEAARAQGAGRIWAIFQPHRYTRTRFLMDDFAGAFDGCERVYVLDIYPAGEEPIPGITSERLVERMRALGCRAARYAASEADLIAEILGEVESGVLILTIGAGSVWKVGEALVEGLGKTVTSDQ